MERRRKNPDTKALDGALMRALLDPGIGKFVILLGTLAGLLFIVAGVQLYSHGQNLTQLQSVSGGTVAEAYYQEIGYTTKGQALAAFGVGASVIAISVGLGALLMQKSSLKIGKVASPTIDPQS